MFVSPEVTCYCDVTWLEIISQLAAAIESLMKLVLALVTPTNADHDVATMIFVIITKKKKPNIKKAQC